MGRRLYFRKKNIVDPQYGKSLGKLYSYVGVYNGPIKSVDYLSSIGALDKFFKDFDSNDTKSFTEASEKFEALCCIGYYFSYGEFFELTVPQFKTFIKLYAEDYNNVYKDTIWTDNAIQEIIDLIDSEPADTIFEFSISA